MFAAFLSALLFSMSVICGHRSAKMIGGVEANFWRVAFATGLLGVWSFGFGVGLSGQSLPFFLLSGILGIGVGDTAFFQALPRLGPRLSLLLIECLSAPMGAILEWFWLGTTLTGKQMVSCAVILAGVGVALKPSQHLQASRRQIVVGTLFSVVGAIATAFGAVLSRKAYALAAAEGIHIDGGDAAFQRVIGGLLLAGLCLLLVKRQVFRIPEGGLNAGLTEATARKWRAVWPWVLLNSLAGQTLGVSCMQWALEGTPTGIVLSVIALAPIFVIPLAMVFEKERPTRHSLAGAFIGVAGVIALTSWR